ncbi:hypothetical protein U9M48_041652 [Paspalum notatum var. saurae]|uniref:Uncharacterized protein n=1 Tax=Paspalum notatum var. saurae TaxID=547442 RepID=A0AAQ3XGS0_PASNO
MPWRCCRRPHEPRRGRRSLHVGAGGRLLPLLLALAAARSCRQLYAGAVPALRWAVGAMAAGRYRGAPYIAAGCEGIADDTAAALPRQNDGFGDAGRRHRGLARPASGASAHDAAAGMARGEGEADPAARDALEACWMLQVLQATQDVAAGCEGMAAWPESWSDAHEGGHASLPNVAGRRGACCKIASLAASQELSSLLAADSCGEQS